MYALQYTWPQQLMTGATLALSSRQRCNSIAVHRAPCGRLRHLAFHAGDCCACLPQELVFCTCYYYVEFAAARLILRDATQLQLLWCLLRGFTTWAMCSICCSLVMSGSLSESLPTQRHCITP
jgi:hypothetical protein